MDRFVIRQNIERYVAQLKRETDDGCRCMLERLLVEEQAKLDQIDKTGDAKDCEDPTRRGVGE